MNGGKKLPENTKIKEKILVRKALKGDKEAFTQLVLQCEDTMFGTAMSILKNRDDACDCMQDAIVDAYEKLSTLREEKYFKTWLIRILINRCYSLLKKRSREAKPQCVAELQAAAHDADIQIDVQRTLFSLKEKDRLILSLYYMEDIPIREIARIMSITEGAARLRLMRSRENFKDAYKAG